MVIRDLKKNGTSETLRNETVAPCLQIENVKVISEHVPRHLRPATADQFGYYLAGLIEGDGHFSNASLAYYIKKIIGFGSIKKVKDKNAFLFIISSKEGLEKVIKLINGKLITENKYNQIMNNILNHKIDFKFQCKDLNNHWLAGFSDADASFQIKNFNRQNRFEVRLNFQIDQKNKEVLLLIKDFVGGNIGYRKTQDTYYCGSTSFGSAKNLLSTYLIIKNKDHLTKDGMDKIIKLKSTMNNFATV
ncbi:homing endonuclease [Rhizopogon vinicolor AM-OR11-026]|uniref:Homing endonuclease n=1 Tax=Rhizopogon vinicolor AM-OR11-026 TaxID=1314800 RepID=A0A1B7MEF1_9AGAM|nr:homing endonuclease [Rhizopogon vinicolor AM-OR11-026]